MSVLSPIYEILTPTLGELEWKMAPNDQLLAYQLAWMELLKKQFPVEITQIRQGFTVLTIQWKSPMHQMEFAGTLQKFEVEPSPLPTKIWEIPVCYEQPFSPDLANLAMSKGLAVEEVVELHAAQPYRIHFFGFLPGFMYLNGLPEQLFFPRKSIPAREVEAGSVAIGGSQTGIYPMKSPGGWHLVGKTPISLFSAHNSSPVWAKAGDLIQFFPISYEEFHEIAQNPDLWML